MQHVTFSFNTKETKYVSQVKICVIYLCLPHISFLTFYKRQKSSTTFWLNLLDFLPTLDITIKSQNKCLPFTNWHVFTTFVWGCSIDKSKPVKKSSFGLDQIDSTIIIDNTFYNILFLHRTKFSIKEQKQKMSMYLRSAVGCSHL